MINDFISIFNRDLDKLTNEVVLFKLEENLWRTTGSIINPAGNLCLHLIGNLNTYIGKNMGNTGYVRDRPAEFSTKNVRREIILQKIAETKLVVSETLAKCSDDLLQKPYPENVYGYEMTHAFMLISLAAHLSWHNGQINYIRRVFE